MGGDGANENDTIAKAQAVAAVANSRKDCVAFISPWSGCQVATSGGAALSSAQQLSKTLEFMENISSSSYVVLDSGIKYTYDRFNDKYRYVGCNGDVAGLCVSTSAILDDWFSPAGTNRGGLQNVVKLAFNPNKAQRDDLYTNRVNPIVRSLALVLFSSVTRLVLHLLLHSTELMFAVSSSMLRREQEILLKQFSLSKTIPSPVQDLTLLSPHTLLRYKHVEVLLTS